VDLSVETTAYAVMWNGLTRAQAELEPDELEKYLEDLARARRAMEVAWLERMADAPDSKLQGRTD